MKASLLNTTKKMFQILFLITVAWLCSLSFSTIAAPGSHYLNYIQTGKFSVLDVCNDTDIPNDGAALYTDIVNETFSSSLDHSVALQKAIDIAITEGIGEIIIPRVLRLKSTINIGGSGMTARGLSFRGIGDGGDYWYSTANPKTQTSLVWAGDDNDIMFILDNATAINFTKIAFSGSISANSSQADVAVALRTQVGAVGYIGFSHVSFHHFTEDAVQCGRNGYPTETNNSDVSFEHVIFNDMTNALHVFNVQGLNYLANFIVANNVRAIFNFEQGGSLVANMISNNADWLLKVGSGGPNVGNFIFNGVRLEKSTINGTGWTGLIWTDSTLTTHCNAIVELNSVLLSQNQPIGTNFFMELHRGIQVKLRNSRINDKRLAHMSGIPPTMGIHSTLDIEDCKLDEDSFLITDYISYDNAYVKVNVRRMHKNNGSILPDVSVP